MPSKPGSWMTSNRMAVFGVLTASLALNACGLLGEKTPPQTQSNVSATGCLNESSDLVSRYFEGSMTTTEWKSSFDCINQSLDFFTNFVRGTAADSYTQGDMYTLITRFLITNGKVRRDLMRGAFGLKAALFGGDQTEFKKEEIELLKNSLNRLRDITADLIPYLQVRQKSNPTSEELLELIQAFKRAGDQLSDFVQTLPTNELSAQAMDLLFQELTYTLNLASVEALGDKVTAAKWFMFNTRKDAFEGRDWSKLFRSAFGLGGIWLAFRTETGTDANHPKAKIFDRLGNDPEFRNFILELFKQARPFVDESLLAHQGITPLPVIDHLIDSLPESLLEDWQKNEAKKALRPLIYRLLQSKSQTGLDSGVIDATLGFLESMVADLNQLDRFYRVTGLDIYDVPQKAFETTIKQYEQSLSGSDQVAFARIRASLLAHAPMVFRDTGVIRYDNSFGYSKLQAQIAVAFKRFLGFVHQSYGSGQDHFVESDFVEFFKDYTDVLFAFRMIDRTVARFGQKRFQDLDLFTPLSNGNKKAEFDEVTSYAMMLISSGFMTSKMKKEIGAACTEDRGIDLMGSRWIEPECFRSQFHDRLDYWLGDSFPRFREYWKSLNTEDRRRAMRWLEHGARRNGFPLEAGSNPNGDIFPLEFGSFDFQAMAVVIHYTESLFTRFDKNQTEVLSKSEVNSAYSLFKVLIQKTAFEKFGSNINSDWILKGVFSYIVRYREMPTVKLNDLGSTSKFGWWLIRYSFTNYSADRLGVFNIVCQLAAPDSKTQADLTSTICLP